MTGELAKVRRRDLLRLACLGGVGLAIPLIKSTGILWLQDQHQEFEKSINALGTMVRIRVEDDFSPVRAQLAISEALTEIARLEVQLTRFQAQGETYRLNQTSEVVAPASEFVELLGRARYFSDATEGAFDITVKPALDLLRNYIDGRSLPSDADFALARSLIDYERVSFSKDIVRLSDPRMGITLDCIGKGYILDRAASILRSYGIRSALVQGGGTMVAIGRKLDGSSWRIGIRNPSDPSRLIATIGLANGAIATSGDYENFFSADGRFYHIIDPTTARSPLYSHSATVTAPTALEADPLGLTLMVKKPSDGSKLLEGFKGCESLIVTRDGRFVQSNGFGVTD
jgi:thiamine biosynthesis lipoprotein